MNRLQLPLPVYLPRLEGCSKLFFFLFLSLQEHLKMKNTNEINNDRGDKTAPCGILLHFLILKDLIG